MQAPSTTTPQSHHHRGRHTVKHLVLSLDIETYGSCTHGHDGTPLPEQTCFHPLKSLASDGVPPTHLILTCSLTSPQTEIPCPLPPHNWTESSLNMKPTATVVGTPTPKTVAVAVPAPAEATPSSKRRAPPAPAPTNITSSPGSSTAAEWLSSLTPGPTTVLQLHRKSHLRALRDLLSRTTILFGMNLPFDIIYLRTLPGFRSVLTDDKWIIDASWLNYLQNETTPERSLKDIGPALGIYRYDEDKTLRSGKRFPSPSDPGHLSYNAQDTHNSILAISELAHHIATEFPNTDKLSPYCLRSFSELAWTVIRMQESGVPLSRSALLSLERNHLRRVARLDHLLAKNHGILISGKGSGTSKDAFMENAFKELDASPTLSTTFGVPSIYEYPSIQYTKALKKLACSSLNRAIVAAGLPPETTTARALRRWSKREESNRIVSTYTFPLLRHKRNPKAIKPKESVALRVGSTDTLLAYPSIYIVPGSIKDTGDDRGGQIQGRLSARAPAVTTFPPAVKACVRSRFGTNGTIVGADLSQIELRTAALLSGDASLLRNYQENRDLHADRAVFIFGPSILNHPNFRCGDMRLDPRQWSKTFNFEDLYLAGAIAMQANLLEASGQLFPLSFFFSIIDSRATLRPGLHAWQQSIIAEANTTGYLVLPITGHSRWFFGAEKPNEIVNFPIQTTAALTMCAIQRRIHHLLPSINQRNSPVHLFTNWYDANYFDCRTTFLPTLRSIIEEAVTFVATQEYWAWISSHYGRTVPLKYEVTTH